MANELAVTTAGKMDVVESIVQLDTVAGETIAAGAPCRIDATTGLAMNGNGSDMTEGKFAGIALASVIAGQALTLLRRGQLGGFTFGSIGYGATIYLSDTDARLSHVAGTKAVTVGYVVCANAQLLGSAPDKVLLVDPSLAAAIT